MLPPRPPLPPSGPPRGLNFSRWTDAQPWPPLPARAWMTTRSMNRGIGCPFHVEIYVLQAETQPMAQNVDVDVRTLGFAACDLDDVDELASAPGTELHGPGGGGEQGVVPTATDVDAGMEVGAALTDQDLAGLDDLAAEPLDAESLRVRVTTVA